MRFILNFFFFGFIFYMIWIFFPEAFQTLVSWANSVYQFVRDGFNTVMDSMSKNKTESSHASTQALFTIEFFRSLL